MVGVRPSTNTPSPDPLSLNEPASEPEDMIIIQSRPRREPPITPKSDRKNGVSVKTPTKTPSRRKRKAESEQEEEQDGAGGQSSTAAATSALKRNPSKRVKKFADTTVVSQSKPRGRAAQTKVSKAVSKLAEGNNGDSSNKATVQGPETEEGLRTPRKRAIPKKYDDNVLTPKSGRKARTPKAQPVKPAGPGRKARADTKQVDPSDTVRDEGSWSGSDDQDSDSDEDDDEEAFELDSKTSRAKFLENERRRKLNGARNFVFTGDANEARRTRSGKAVVAVEAGVEDEEIMDDQVGNEMAVDGEQTADAAAFEDRTGDENLEIDLGVDIDYTVPEDLEVQDHPTEPRPAPPAAINQVSPFIQARLDTILSNLSAPPSWNPPPFATEGPENEALTSLVNLLRGTIGRGEGNSCLVVGSKGSGKSRVSLGLIFRYPEPI
jgi:origin recognition complex subunit 4